MFTGLDHHQKEAVFATCGQQVDIWDEQRSSPIRSFTWGVDSFSSVRFNPVEVRHRVSDSIGRCENTFSLRVCCCRNLPKSADGEKSATLLVCLTVYIFPQTELLASCASDRSIVLYDMRESAPLKKVGSTFQLLLEFSFCSPHFFTITWYDVYLLSSTGYYDNEEQHSVLEPYGSI